MPLNPSQLKSVLRSVNARWTAAPAAPLRHALGYTPGPEEHSLTTREMLARSNNQHFMAMSAMAVAAPPYPSAWDWRKVNGKNYVTAVKDQGGCGSCVAFGCVAAVESVKRLAAKKATLKIDLSEAHLFYCHGAAVGRNCEKGWYPDGALAAFQASGVTAEPYFPYTGGDQPCNPLAGWNTRLTKIDKWHKITSVADMKTWLSTHGPLVTCFTVYDDFYNYKGGVYHHVSGAKVSGHCVCCVGYDDTARYWICKNSWGTGFGEKGYFRIAYGQVGIDAAMWAAQV